MPYLQLDASDEAILHLTWEEPFSFDSFPIVKYYISVLDINQMALSHVTLNPDTRAFNFTAMGLDTTCTELTFRVIAENRVGNSSAAIVRGAFPSRESGYCNEWSSNQCVLSQGQDFLQRCPM